MLKYYSSFDNIIVPSERAGLRKMQRKVKKSIKVLLILLCFVFLGIFAISGYQLISTLNQYKQAENAYNDVNDRYVTDKVS